MTTRSNSIALSAAHLTDLRRVSYNLGRSVEGTNEITLGLFGTTQPLVDPPRERGSASPTALLESTNTAARGTELITEAIRLFRLRYWDGSAWFATWAAGPLPRGVEVTLGVDPLPDDAPLTDYPGEIFRRVIRLPAGRDGEGIFEPFDADHAASSPPSPKP